MTPISGFSRRDHRQRSALCERSFGLDSEYFSDCFQQPSPTPTFIVHIDNHGRFAEVNDRIDEEEREASPFDEFNYSRQRGIQKNPFRTQVRLKTEMTEDDTDQQQFFPSVNLSIEKLQIKKQKLSDKKAAKA